MKKEEKIIEDTKKEPKEDKKAIKEDVKTAYTMEILKDKHVFRGIMYRKGAKISIDNVEKERLEKKEDSKDFFKFY